MNFLKLNKLSDEELAERTETFEFFVIIKEKPENYIRERFTSRGHRFYNKKGSKMQKFAAEIKKQLKDNQDYKTVASFINKEDEIYFLELENIFYLPIPINDSKITKERKQSNKYPVIQRPDIDNYLKFVLDSLHGVFYSDDCRVISERSEKRFVEKEETRTEIKVKITRYK